MWKIIYSAILTILFATVALAQGANYEIRPGDRLNIEVLEDPSLNRNLLVLPDGRISFPMAGNVPAQGRTVAQLQADLKNRLAPNFASPPSVFVSVQALTQSAPRSTGNSRRKIEVFLIGEAQNPGMHEISRGTNLLQFLAQTGGFTRFAAKKRIQLRRTVADGTTRTFRINYRTIESGGNVPTAAAQLQDGDVIVVPERRLFE